MRGARTVKYILRGVTVGRHGYCIRDMRMHQDNWVNAAQGNFFWEPAPIYIRKLCKVEGFVCHHFLQLLSIILILKKKRLSRIYQ